MKSSILKCDRFLAALAVVALTVSMLGQAEAATKKIKGHFNLATPTEVAGIMFAPGYYEVKQINSASGTLVRFTRVTDNFYAPEGISPYDSETVAEVPVTGEPMLSAATRTGFVLAGGRATGLQIRGNDLEYHFSESMAEGN